MLDLKGARLKVERAYKHICDLDREKARFLAENPYSVTPEYHAEHDATAYRLHKFTDTPDPIPLIAGDAAHNLRSALDHLACALARRAGNDPGTSTYFPITETPEDYESDGRRKIKLLSCPDQKAIGLLKPYAGGNDLLWGLHRLDIIDKHKILITPAICVSKLGFQVSQADIEKALGGLIRFLPSQPMPTRRLEFSIPPNFLAFKENDEILWIAGNLEQDENVQLTYDIALGEPEILKGWPILETLVQLKNLVDGIISSFE
jgi:hypothetical protein